MTDSEDPADSPGGTQALDIIEPGTGMPVPAVIATAGERAALRLMRSGEGSGSSW